MSREIVEKVFSPDIVRELWSGNYEKAIPITIQDFDLAAILPAVFYMFRFGKRRGKGKFLSTFAPEGTTSKEKQRLATIDRVAEVLSQEALLEGFQGETERAVLGDLLLCYCLENRNRAVGREEVVRRVAPTHYMASWVDLPEKVSDLRYVPEMIVALLANQHDDSDYVQLSRPTDRTWFPVGNYLDRNVLLKTFSEGIHVRGEDASRASDKFDEATHVGIDQLLMIRLAQKLGEAPQKLHGKEENISNQRPIAERAADNFSEDIRRFTRTYATVIPRQSFVIMLESCMAVGLTTILANTVDLLLGWLETGEIPKKPQQNPIAFFVDASNGTNRKIRDVAEWSFDDFLRKFGKLPELLMLARLLDSFARRNPKIKKSAVRTTPLSTEWINLLGEILHERHQESDHILYQIESFVNSLAEQLKDEYPELAESLEDAESCGNPAQRLAGVLTALFGRKNTIANLLDCLDSTLLVDCPNGLATKRRTFSGNRARVVRSLTFTDAVLDYLVHLHLLPSGHGKNNRPLSVKDFLRVIRDRYGFYIDQSCPGMSVPSELLRENRAILERRLRDLGLLIGVNDAEAMKRLRPRFETPLEKNHELD